VSDHNRVATTLRRASRAKDTGGDVRGRLARSWRRHPFEGLEFGSY
jgi:hypothetical protein